MKITRAQMIEILDSIPLTDRWLHYINEYMDTFEINTPLRASHFIAQCLHETLGLKLLKEKGQPRYFRKYEVGGLGRMLGNTQKGDGYKYRGRGLMMITGRYNYNAYQKSGYCKGDIMENPELLEGCVGATKSGMWWWWKHGLNKLADEDNFLAITKKINGGTNGLDDRKKWLDKCKKILCK